MQTNEKLKVAFETLGCRSNYADTVDLQAALLEKNCEPLNFDSAADVYVINTCTVTNDADKTALKLIKKAKRQSPNSKIIVTGCMAEVSPDAIRQLGIVDAVIGPGKRQDVLAAILGKEDFNSEMNDVVEIKKRSKVNWHSISLDQPISEMLPGPGMKMGDVRSRSRYHLRVQEGCENSCTFCIIPVSRGKLTSRPVERILEDLNHLGKIGYNEVVLTGTHLGGYGEDCNDSLFNLLKILSEKSPIKRLRLSSIDPNDVNTELIDLIADNEIFCKHLHICIQAFSDKTLKRMNRRYKMKDVYSILEYLNKKIPQCGLGSDLITGFPGETREEAEEGIEIFRNSAFNYLHVFPYSEREGTAATLLDQVVPAEERRRRTGRWRAVAEQQKKDYYSSFIGKNLEVVVEYPESGVFYGTSREFIAVKINSSSRELHAGESLIVTAKALDQTDGLLICQI